MCVQGPTGETGSVIHVRGGFLDRLKKEKGTSEIACLG